MYVCRAGEEGGGVLYACVLTGIYCIVSAKQGITTLMCGITIFKEEYHHVRSRIRVSASSLHSAIVSK